MMIILKNIGDVKVGYQSKSRILERSDGLYRLIQGKDFTALHDLREKTLLKFYPERNPNLYFVCKGDILFQARGTAHFAYCMTKELSNTLAFSSFYIIRLKTKDILPEYLAWWLNQKSAQTYFNIHAKSTAISFISKKSLLQLDIKIPSLVVQEKVHRAVALLQKEAALQHELLKRRTELVNAVCMWASDHPYKIF